VEAHILVAFLAYCLQVRLKNSLRNQAPELNPQAVMEKLASIQTIDVWIPARDNRWLVLPRYTQPSLEVQILPDTLHIFPSKLPSSDNSTLVFVVKTCGYPLLIPFNLSARTPSECEIRAKTNTLHLTIRDGSGLRFI
jgi:hypothetical protein